VRAALATAPVEQLTLSFGSARDVAAVACLPHLRRLVLDGFAQPFALEGLAPLRTAPKLEALHLRWTIEFPVAQVRALLPRLAVTSHGY
jgi:hypothetical protein